VISGLAFLRRSDSSLKYFLGRRIARCFYPHERRFCMNVAQATKLAGRQVQGIF